MKTASLIFRALIVFAVLSAFLLSGRTPIASPAEAQTNKRIQKSQRREQTSKWPSKSERWALIIGVDKYPYSQQLRMLKGAAKDAEDLKNALIRHANFQEDRVILMTNEQPENLQPTLGNIFQQLSRLKNASKDGLLLVSFAGHGIQYERRAFLVPTDARDDHDWALLARTSIDVTDMKEWILDTGVRQVVIILDACRNNPPGRGNTDNSQAKAYARGLNLDARNREVEAFALLYATTEGGLAFEDSKEQRGHFTRAVIEALSGGAANEKGEVTLGGLVKYVQEEVPKRAKRQGEQKPDYEMRGYKADELVIAIASPPPT
ncbi:MAG: caspase family protein, partial [Blastocatellia bacterium]